MSKKFVLGELSDTHPFVTDIKATLEKATGQVVAFLVVDKLKNRVGIPTKKITFNFEEGQSIGLVIRKDGDVIQHSLNGKNIPLLNVMDFDKMDVFNAGLEKLALKLKSNQEKFNQKRQAARVMTPRKPSTVLTVRKKIEQARETLKDLNAQIEANKANLAQKKAELEAVQ